MKPFRFAAFVLLALSASLPARADGAYDPALGVPFALRDRPTLGAADAPVTVIAVRSFRCGGCRQFHETVFPSLRRDYVETGRVRWVALDADDSEPRHTVFEVARAAQAAGVYWEMTGFLFTHARRPPSVLRSAVEHGEVPGRRALLEALRNGSARAAAEADLAEARLLRLENLPAILIRKCKADGTFEETRFDGDLVEAKLRAALDRMLANPTSP